MQCFQKDPNLRVSARKLLKHPWIVNARRSDSVVPKKSTEYEEAVKSVQEWNEALRSPEPAASRRGRSDSQNPPSLRLDTRYTPTKDTLPSPVSRHAADRFRSPNSTEEDNWDDDFATAISPSALQLPHLRPHDNFGGMLSSEKLKAFASLDGTVLKSDDSFEELDDPFGRSLQAGEPDPLKTIRPSPSQQTGTGTPQTQSAHYGPQMRRGPPLNTSINPSHGGQMIQNSSSPIRQQRPPGFYKENSVEDYSDIIIDNEDVLDRKISAFQVSTPPSHTGHVIKQLTPSRRAMIIQTRRSQQGPEKLSGIKAHQIKKINLNLEDRYP